MDQSSVTVAPEFEITDPSLGAVNYIEHGYPSPLVRWHCHNEYELHYIAASSGKVFVGDYIGEFHPGNVILTGPRLPHNWISDTPAGETYELRDMLVHFAHTTIESVSSQMPELRELMPLLEEARRGIEFFGMRERADHYMHAMRESTGPARLGFFCQFMDELTRCRDYRTLSTTPIESISDSPQLDKVDTVINYVMHNYHLPITLSQAAAQVSLNESYFSRFVKKATGNTFSALLTQVRISAACERLIATDDAIASICHEVGYHNVANFNRRFQDLKQVTPREYRVAIRRRLTRGGDTMSEAPTDTQ